MLDKLPRSLHAERDTLRRCFEAFGRTRPIRQIMLFGSHARGESGPSSDVDLCIVADNAERQFDTARDFRRAIRGIRPKPPFTLVPISPARLAEKQACGDHFFATVLKEGICLAEED